MVNEPMIFNLFGMATWTFDNVATMLPIYTYFLNECEPKKPLRNLCKPGIRLSIRKVTVRDYYSNF